MIIKPRTGPKVKTKFGVSMSAAASGSNGISVADDTEINFGTGDFTLVWKGSLPSATPSVFTDILRKFSGAGGWQLFVRTTGELGFGLARASGPVAITEAAYGYAWGEVVELAMVVVRDTASTAGSLSLYANGALRTSAAITALATETVDNAQNLTISGGDGVRAASLTNTTIFYNRALSASEVLDLYSNGVNSADVGASQVAIYTSDFSVNTDGFSASAVTLTPNTDSIGGEDNWLKAQRASTSGAVNIRKNSEVSDGKMQSISVKIRTGASNTFTTLKVRGAGGSGTESSVISAPAGTTVSVERFVMAGSFMDIVVANPDGSSASTVPTTDLFYIKEIINKQAGATLQLESSGIAQGSGLTWLDSSGNWNNATLPATGATKVQTTGTIYDLLQPTLDLQFARHKTLDSRITFTRASSGTYWDADGVLQTATTDAPRFTHDPVTGESLGLMIEEARTNLLTYSEEFDNAAWTNNETTESANAITAPDGTLTADKLIGDVGGTNMDIRQSPSLTVSQTYSMTVYAKAAELTKFRLGGYAFGAGFATITFDLITGAVTENVSGLTGSATDAGNGWWRFSVSGGSFAGGPNTIIPAGLSVTGNPATGDGTSGIYIWGAQLEAGAFPTSYIKTTSATVTRAADSATMTGTDFSSWFNTSEGTFVFNGALALASGRFPGLYKTGTTNPDRIGSYVGGSGSVDFFRNTEVVTVSSVVSQQTFKHVSSYSLSDIAACLNAGAVSSSSAADSLSAPTGMAIGKFDETMSGTIASLTYYQIRPPNELVQYLTK